MTAEGEKGDLITIGADGNPVPLDTAVAAFARGVTDNSDKHVVITDLSPSSPEARPVQVNPGPPPSKS